MWVALPLRFGSGNAYVEVLGNATIDLCANDLVDSYNPGSFAYSEVLGNATIDLLASALVDTYVTPSSWRARRLDGYAHTVGYPR